MIYQEYAWIENHNDDFVVKLSRFQEFDEPIKKLATTSWAIAFVSVSVEVYQKAINQHGDSETIALILEVLRVREHDYSRDAKMVGDKVYSGLSESIKAHCIREGIKRFDQEVKELNDLVPKLRWEYKHPDIPWQEELG